MSFPWKDKPHKYKLEGYQGKPLPLHSSVRSSLETDLAKGTLKHPNGDRGAIFILFEDWYIEARRCDDLFVICDNQKLPYKNSKLNHIKTLLLPQSTVGVYFGSHRVLHYLAELGKYQHQEDEPHTFHLEDKL